MKKLALCVVILAAAIAGGRNYAQPPMTIEDIMALATRFEITPNPVRVGQTFTVTAVNLGGLFKVHLVDLENNVIQRDSSKTFPEYLCTRDLKFTAPTTPGEYKIHIFTTGATGPDVLSLTVKPEKQKKRRDKGTK